MLSVQHVIHMKVINETVIIHFFHTKCSKLPGYLTLTAYLYWEQLHFDGHAQAIVGNSYYIGKTSRSRAWQGDHAY